MIRHARARDFSVTDVPLRWDADGTLRDTRHGRTYVIFTVPAAVPPPVAPEPPSAPRVPAVRQAFDAVALTSVITGIVLLLRISLRF